MAAGSLFAKPAEIADVFLAQVAFVDRVRLQADVNREADFGLVPLDAWERENRHGDRFVRLGPRTLPP